jgi:hypothetical protein
LAENIGLSSPKMKPGEIPKLTSNASSFRVKDALSRSTATIVAADLSIMAPNCRCLNPSIALIARIFRPTDRREADISFPPSKKKIKKRKKILFLSFYCAILEKTDPGTKEITGHPCAGRRLSVLRIWPQPRDSKAGRSAAKTHLLSSIWTSASVFSLESDGGSQLMSLLKIIQKKIKVKKIFRFLEKFFQNRE